MLTIGQKVLASLVSMAALAMQERRQLQLKGPWWAAGVWWAPLRVLLAKKQKHWTLLQRRSLRRSTAGGAWTQSRLKKR
eukprot:6301270-Prorocentrum_lima.AAC.1